MKETTVNREFIVKIRVEALVESESLSYPELADKLDFVDMPGLLANGLAVDCDRFAGEILNAVSSDIKVHLGDPEVCNVHDVTGEDVEAYISGPEEKGW